MGVPISNVTRRVVYAASGTGPYAFTFEILANTDIAVYRDDTLLTLTTDYTVTINSNGTGSITLTAAPTGATQIAIVGNRTISRTTDFVTGGDFFANTVNDELDQQTIFAQQNAEGLQRALQAPQTDPTSINMTLPRASVRASKVLSFDASGNPAATEFIGSNRGNWASGRLYYVRDIVKDTSTSNIWQCVTQHTSSGAQPISTNADAAKWFLLVDAASAGASATAAANSATAAAASQSAAATSATNAASSASTASTQASNASTSATNAASSASTASTAATNAGNSATAAATSASNASTSATNAASSASSASTSATNAASSASSASTSASNASTSATNAANSATSAASSATTATNQATTATTQASNAATSATNAANSATAAATSETNAAASAAAAAAALDNFDDRYLGAKSSNPTVDNDGNALVTGALYYRTTTPVGMKVWDGAQWLEASAAQQALMVTYEFVATAGQTTFSGTDANGATLSYVANSISVSLNGAVLRPGDDYTATSGTSIVLTSAASLNDELMVIAFAVFNVANAVAKTGDTMTGALTYNPGTANGVAYLNGSKVLTTGSGLTFDGSQLDIPAGTAAAPSLSTPADPDTGLFFPAANQLAASVGGSEGMRLTSTGLGIGTSSPDAKLTVNGGGNSLQARFSGVTGRGLAISTFTSAGTSDNGVIYNAGIFADAQHVWQAGGTERMRLDNLGNLGLGVTPSAWDAGFKVMQLGGGAYFGQYNSGAVHMGINTYFNGTNYIYTTTGVSTRYTQNAGAHAWWNAPSGTAGNAISFTQAMTLDASGNLLVGATSNVASNRAFFAGTGGTTIRVSDDTNSNFRGYGIGATVADATEYASFKLNANSGEGRITIGNVSYGGFLTMYTAGSERARIDSSGNLLVGTTSQLQGTGATIATDGKGVSAFLNVKASNTASCDAVLYLECPGVFGSYVWSSRANSQLRIATGTQANGVSLASGGTSWGSFSDERLKDIIEPITNATEKVSSLRAVIGRYKTDDTEKRRAFLIAQDVQAVLPEAVYKNSNDDDTLSLAYTETIPLLVAAIKEQQAIIDAQASVLEQLKADVAALKAGA